MGSSLRRWLACILPCGALDVVRVVHINGHVEEHSSPVSAGEILAANPGYILSLPCTHGVVPRVLIVSPSSVLKRGHIYFLIPDSSLPEADVEKKKKKKKKKKKEHKEEVLKRAHDSGRAADDTVAVIGQRMSTLPVVKSSSHRRRCRSVPAVVWRPQLEQISEDPLKYPMPDGAEEG